MLGQTTVHLTNKRKGSLTRSAWRWVRRRAAIEPVIGHLKSDTRLDRNYLLGEEGNRINAILSGCGFNVIALLILRLLQLRPQFNWFLSNLAALLRMSLFTHRDLWAWLNKLYETPPIPYEPEQLRFCFR